MHIAFNGWFWDQENTGSGQYIRRLLPALRRVEPGLKMTLILPGNGGTPDGLPEGVEVIHTGGGRGNLAKVMFEQRAYPAAVRRSGADIAHVPYWGAPLSSPARLVTSVLDVIPLVLPQYAAGFLPRLYTSLVSATARGSAHVITLSEASKADIVQQLKMPADQVSAIHLAVDDAYHPRLGAEHDEAVRQKYNLPESFVLYMGGFDIRKQVNQLLLAYTYVKQGLGEEYPLVIAGREPAWGTPMFPDLRDYTEKLGLTDLVRWIGYVDDADKPALYRLANVFVYPSRYEGFGLPVLEGMASGTPVVANDVSSIPEVGGQGVYLVPDGDARQMAGAIIAMLIQDDLRATMVNYGLAQATRFNWRKTARETYQVYEKVMALPSV